LPSSQVCAANLCSSQICPKVSPAYRCMLVLLMAVAVGCSVRAQTESQASTQDSVDSCQKSGSHFAQNVFDLLNMAGAQKAKEFRPLTQDEGNHQLSFEQGKSAHFVRCAVRRE